MFMGANLGFGTIFVWLPIFSDQVLGGGPQLYGILLGALAVGEVGGSILAGSVVLSLALGGMIALAQMLAGASLGLMLIDQGRLIVGASLALFGIFSAPLTIWAQTLRMQIIPERLRGRTFALLRTLMQSAIPAGGAAAGVLLPLIGIPALIGLSSAVIIIPGFIGYQVKQLRHAGQPATT